MDYITVKEAAAKWSFVERSIQNYCANGKIPGAKCIGGQWFIPADAKPPLDGRTKAARAQQGVDNYRFPVFVYSRYYRNPSELTHDEQRLLQAQLLHFEGKHKQSLMICNELLNEKQPSYLNAGIWFTIGIDSFILGLVAKYKEAVTNLERIEARENGHKEDFHLMTAALKYYIDWNSNKILEICSSNLSLDASWYYQTLIICVSALSANGISIQYLKYLEAETTFFEKEGIMPMLYFLYCGLGAINDCNRTQAEKEKFLKKGVDLAVEHHWVHNLHRFYNFSPVAMAKILKSHGDAYHNELLRAQKESLANWNIVHRSETGTDSYRLFSSKQFELLHLICYGYTDQELALCLGLSESIIKRREKELMEISGTKNKSQLRAYAIKFFDATLQETEVPEQENSNK